MFDLQLINDTSGKWKFNCVIVDGEPWFRGRDIGQILGYPNPAKAIRDHVRDKHKKKCEELGGSDLDHLDYNDRNLVKNRSFICSIVRNSYNAANNMAFTLRVVADYPFFYRHDYNDLF